MSLIILFSEMLKIFKEKKVGNIFFLKKNKEFDGIFENTSFVEMKSSKSINQSIN
jgi:hypothetical protein